MAYIKRFKIVSSNDNEDDFMIKMQLKNVVFKTIDDLE